jgi:acetyl esterase
VASPDPVTREFLDMLAGGPPAPALQEMSPADAREMAAGMRAVFPDTVAAPPVEIEHHLIPGGPTGDLTIQIVRPPGIPGPLPAVMFFHGGGWVLCDYGTHARLVQEIAVGAAAAVVFVDYSRSPEVRFPVANEQAYFATRYVAEHGSELRLDPSRIAVAGDSAGANMATVVCMLALTRGGPAISGAVLFYPVTAANFETPSYIQFADGHFLTRDSMRWFWDNYLPDPAARLQPDASPLLAPIDRLRGHPPTFVMTCEFDVLRDEGEDYARLLATAGVPVASARYLGAIHSCLTLGPLANTPAVRAAVAAANDHLREVLGSS